MRSGSRKPLSRRYAVCLVCLTCAAFAPACSRTTRGWLRLGDGKLPNVLLITIDTLRADHLGCYDSRFGDPTPNLDRFAADATLFLHAMTPAPATLPALASLHTGLYPGRHPVRSNIARLPYNVPVIAEILRALGYTTAAYYGNSLLVPHSGFARGFDTYVSFVANLGGPSDAHGAELARDWLSKAARPPWFLWVHFMDPHGPYNSAPASWSDAPDGRDPLPDRELTVSETDYGLGVIPKYQALPGLTHASEYRRRYRGEIRFCDAQVGRLLGALDELGMRSTTLVVITADHGESLGEHNCYFQHGWFPYEETIRVPFLVRLPGGVSKARRVQELVSLVDFVPTLLAGLNVSVQGDLEGRDISALLRGGTVDSDSAFAVTPYLNQMTAVRRGNWKLVYTPPPPAPVPGDPWAPFYASGEQFELYDLGQDKGETHNLYSTQRAHADQLWAELGRWQSRHDIPFKLRAVPTPDAATRERLEALGYGPP